MATKIKSPFTNEELKKWRRILQQKRDEITADISDLYKDVMESEDGHTLPTHQADRGSDSFLQDISLGMMDDEEMILWQIKRALEKIDSAVPVPYGICEYTKKPIKKSRLQLIPWTPISIDAAHVMDEEGLTLQDMLDTD